MKRLLLLIFILVQAPAALSMVNMRNASYNEKWVDYIDPEAGIEMKIERFYSSRSLFIGMFGFGWCSKFETHLTITSDGIINLTECGGGLAVTYYPNNFDSKSRDYTIAKIIEDFKKTRKLNASDIANLRTQLKSNTKMRFEYAKQLGLIDDKKIKKAGNSFFSKAKGFEKIVFDGRFYERRLFSGVTETYNQKGQLVKIEEPTGQELKIFYKGKDIHYLKDKKGRRLTFRYSQGRLASISNGKGLTVQYKFMGDNLVEVTNMWKKTYKFNYDPNHNMTSVDFPDNTNMRMTYDLSNDWIKSYTNRKGCREEFDFAGSKEDPKNHYVGSFSRKCKGSKKTYTGKHEFWYRPYVNAKGKFLQRVLEEYRDDSKDVYFHPYFGRPVKITENRVFFRGFSYYDNGFVNTREDVVYQNLNGRRGPVTDWTKSKFDYDRSSYRIKKIEIKNLDRKGKVSKARSLSVDYNRYGLLSKATENKSSFISVGYYPTGKVEKLINAAGEEVRLTHKVGVDKPVEIELKNVGSVKITYDDQGSVASVDSKGKRNIATSIIEKFLSMVSFLGPLGEELEI